LLIKIWCLSKTNKQTNGCHESLSRYFLLFQLSTSAHETLPPLFLQQKLCEIQFPEQQKKPQRTKPATKPQTKQHTLCLCKKIWIAEAESIQSSSYQIGSFSS